MFHRAQKFLRPSLITIQAGYRNIWLIRWLLANIVGWSIGLVVAARLLNLFGIVGALTGGAAAGGIVGIAQAAALRTHPDWQLDFRGWVVQSTLGGALATVPIYLLAFGLLLNFNLTLVLMGMVFGVIFGGLQAWLLWQSVYERALWWVLASAIGGAACAPLSLSASAFWLPVCFSPGSLFFGLITGITVMKLSQMPYFSADDGDDEL